MPKKISEESRTWTLRISVHKTFISEMEIEAMLNELSPACWAWCFEKGKKKLKPHYHTWLESPEQPIRDWLKRKGLKGNEELSLKTADHIEESPRLLSYFMKQGNWKHHGLSSELEASALELNAKYRERENKRSVFQEMKQYMESQGCRPVDDECEDTPNPRCILLGVLRVVKNVISFYSQRECMSSKSQIEAYSNTFSMRYVQGYKQRLEGQIAQRLVGPISEIYN